MSVESRITETVEEILAQKNDQSLFLVDISVSSAKNSQKVLVHLDGDEGVNIDICAEISRQLGAMLEEENLISGSFTLEVSSPGLDLPLKLYRQYRKNIGRKIKVLTEDNETRKGVLKEVGEEQIVMLEEMPDKARFVAIREYGRYRLASREVPKDSRDDFIEAMNQLQEKTQIFKGEGFGNDGSPAIGAKFDRHWVNSL